MHSYECHSLYGGDMEILSNPWFVGITGGVLSGLLTTTISRWILSRRDSREYAQKVTMANREVIYAIRPGIPEGPLPTFDVVEATIYSTARKHAVEAKDLLNAKEVAEDLIKEVMDSNFISAKSKAKFCSQLSYLLIENNVKSEENKKPISETTLFNYRERTITLASLMLGLFATLFTATLGFSRSSSFHFIEPFNIFLPTLVAITGVLFGSYIYFFYAKY